MRLEKRRATRRLGELLDLAHADPTGFAARLQQLSGKWISTIRHSDALGGIRLALSCTAQLDGIMKFLRVSQPQQTRELDAALVEQAILRARNAIQAAVNAQLPAAELERSLHEIRRSAAKGTPGQGLAELEAEMEGKGHSAGFAAWKKALAAFGADQLAHVVNHSSAYRRVFLQRPDHQQSASA